MFQKQDNFFGIKEQRWFWNYETIWARWNF